jgi:hypothetical protein
MPAANAPTHMWTGFTTVPPSSDFVPHAQQWVSPLERPAQSAADWQSCTV